MPLCKYDPYFVKYISMHRKKRGQIIIFKNNYIYRSAVLALRRFVGFYLVVASGGYSLVVVLGLLAAVTSLAVEHRL